MQSSTRRREQEVWQACDDLWAQSADFRSITGDSIRERLLGLGRCKGSPNEIYKYRKTWVAVRGISTDSSNTPHDSDNDPISRAVRMVHEKLQSETEEQIDRLKQSHEEELHEKSQEIIKAKNDLNSLMHEFSKIQDSLLSLQQNFKLTSDQLLAETEVRKALERELEQTALANTQNLNSLNTRLIELKSYHKDEINNMAQLYQKLEEQLNSEIKTLKLEKQELGHEYSQKLGELKTENYNLEILKKRFEEKNQNLILDVSRLKEQRREQGQEINQLQLQVATYKSKQDILAEKLQAKIAENSLQGLALKKCQLKLARTRAILKN